MEIKDSLEKAASVGVNTKPTGPGKNPAKTDDAKSASDSVNISPQAQALSAPAANTGVFDANKVEEIRAAIANGTFKVNPEEVADGLLATVRDLIKADDARKG